VTFGETMLQLSPPNDERLETAREFEVRAAGAESNAAIAAERLGAVTTWMSKLPDTALGHRVDNGLRQYGINTDVVWTDDDDLRQGTYYLESGGRPRGTNVVYDREDAAVTTAIPEELDVDRIRTFHDTAPEWWQLTQRTVQPTLTMPATSFLETNGDASNGGGN